MKRFFLSIWILIICIYKVNPQEIKIGDQFPNYVIRPIINAPVKQFDIAKENKKYLILNFWGTWCAPCIPEMDTLNKLQEKNKEFIHVIAISNETTDRLYNYLKKRPSKLWMASDTASFLYKTFMFNYVGQSVIIDKNNKIVALVRTDSITQLFVDKLISGLPINSSAEVGINSENFSSDPFGIDSSINFSVTLCSARPKDFGSGSPGYSNTPFEGRRKSYFNVPANYLYNAAFEIYSPTQIVFSPDDKTVLGHMYMKLVCFDILVEPGQKDSLNLLMQQALNKLLPFKARVEKRILPVYLLKQKENDTTNWKISDSTETFRMFSGRGFTGIAIPMKLYADYLANELQMPVLDETGLTGKYDINTVNVLRSKEEVLKGMDKLGLKLEKSEREMDVLVFYK